VNFHQSTPCYVQDDITLHSHRCEECPGSILFLSQETADLQDTEKKMWESKLILMKYKIKKDRLHLKEKYYWKLKKQKQRLFIL
jgi:hypothetical protein